MERIQNKFESEFQRIGHELTQAGFIAVVSHQAPDGDSIGSSVALGNWLVAQGKSVCLLVPDGIPENLLWLMDGLNYLVCDEDPDPLQLAIESADLIFCLDHNHLNRTGGIEAFLKQSDTTRIMVDHHPAPDMDAYDVVVSDTDSCSTAEILHGVMTALHNDLPYACMQGLYCGLVTDSGSFRFPSVRSSTHLIVADLIERGLRHWEVHEKVFDQNTLGRIQLRGHAMEQGLSVHHDGRLALMVLDRKTLYRYNASKGDTDGLVNVALSVKGVQMAILLKEDQGFCKISFRSKGDVVVNELADKHFNGGGHRYAAGGRFNGSLQDAERDLIEKTLEYL